MGDSRFSRAYSAVQGAARRHGVEVGVALLAVILTFPTTLHREVGLDASWAAGLQMASSRNLVFGKEVVFTYGPLGYLGNPALYVPREGVLSILFNIGLTFALAMVTIRLLRARFPLWAASLLTIVIVVVVRGTAAAPIVVMLAVAWAIWWVLRERPTLGPVVGMGVIFGPAMLIKFSCVESLIVLGIAVTVAAFLSGGVRLAALHVAVFVGAAMGSLVIVWVLIGQPISALPDWILRSLEVAQGYDDAMGLPLEDAAWIYPVGALLLALAVGAICTAKISTRVRIALLIVVVPTALVTYKESFVRQDGITFFLVAVMVALSLVRILDRRIVPAALAIAIIPVLVLAGEYDEMTDVRSHLSAMRTVKAFTTSSDYRDDFLRAERARALETYAVPDSMLAAVAGRTVDVQPDAMLVAYGDPRMKWDPSPVLQSYAAYTRELDSINASFLTGSKAPEFVLRQPGNAIDHRLARFESPDATLALMCRYREREASGGWQLLERTKNRCGTPRGQKRVETALGERVPIPEPTTKDNIVVARFHGLASSLPDRLQSLVGSGVELWMGTDRWNRFLQGTQGDAHIVRIPECAATALDGPTAPDLSSLVMSDRTPPEDELGSVGDDVGAGRDSYTIEFAEIPFRC